MSEQAIHGLVAVQSVRTQLQVQDGLEWRAISGRMPPDQVAVEIASSVSRMRRESARAASSGLGATRARQMGLAQGRYVALVRRELGLLAAGRADEASELDEMQVDPSFEQVLAQLDQATGELDHRANVMEWISNLGVLLIMTVALGAAARMQRRRRLAESQRAAERASEARYRTLIDQSSDVVLVTDRVGRLTYLSPAAERLLCGSDTGRPTPHLADLLHPDDRQFLTSKLADPPDSASAPDHGVMINARLGSDEAGWRHFEFAVRDLTSDPGVGGIVLTGRDVTERHILEQEMTHRALHDPLTGLPNRALLADRFEQSLRTEARDHAATGSPDSSGAGTALLLIDLDRFKEINDTLGHHIGDELLTQVGPRLAGVLREVDTVARLGGDEFAVLLPGVRAARDAVAVARKLLSRLTEPYRIKDLDLHVDASIGVVLSGAHGDNAATLLQRADVAMYVAKNQHLGVAVYQPSSDENSPQRLALLADLRRALDSNQLVLHYQPQVALRTGQLRGAEALVRWNHPTRGLLAPDVFIPLAEHTGLIGPLTHHVLSMALAQAGRWLAQDQPLPVSVNLSARNLLDDGLDRHVADLLRTHHVPAHLLVLEVTESAIMTDPERATATLHRLRDLGIRVSIDDFGAGYTSLRQLKDLPVDELKIDRSFVMTMSHRPDDQVIVRSLIDLGHRLGMCIVAEGVESAADLTTLTSYGCDTAQGYHLSRPLPVEDFDGWRASYPLAPPAPPTQRRPRSGLPST